MLFAIPSSTVNSAMEYFSKRLALAFRERLTRHFHQKYLQKMFYYKVSISFIDCFRYVIWTVVFKTQIRDLLRT